MIDLKTLLPREHVILHLAGGSRHELFSALLQPLVDDGIVTDAEQMLHDLESREAEITTQVSDRVAFPHARSHAVRRLALTIGIADAPGLSFNPDVSDCCQAFFLVAVPSFAPTAHLPLLQKIANFAHDDKKLQRLLDSKTPAQAARCIVTFRG